MPKGRLDYMNFEVKASADEEGVFTGYASTWDRDLADDEIIKGAYADTLADDYPEDGAGIPLYWGHNYDSPLNCIGESLSAAEDEKGLAVKFKFDLDTAEGAKAYDLLKRGLVHQMSVGFVAQKTAWVKDDGDQWSHRRIEKARLFEVSVVPIACNQSAEVTDVKSGRAISKDNEDLLNQALDCIKSVLSNIDGSGDEADDDTNDQSSTDKADEKAHALAERKAEIADIAEYLGGTTD